MLYGGRVRKDDIRTQACGSTDEAVAALGLARSFGPLAQGLEQLILEIQKELFVVGAELATDAANAGKLKPGVSKVTGEMVDALEAHIDRMTALAPPPKYFIVPGELPVSAALDLARAVVRRAERFAVTMQAREMLADDALLRYLNRLSDFLFTAARFEEAVRGLQAPPSR